ncbi:MAG: hypothetical protein IKC89_01515 [Lentisphaeria bacterium]|nr:hypothetical protein [Lentisphaeria bacterium]
MKKFLLPVIAIMAAVPLYADNSKLPMNDFLQLSRRRNQTATYARLQGTLQHRRRGAAVISMPVYFGVIIHPDRIIGQLVLAKNEGYMLGQAVNSGLTSVMPMKKDNNGNKLGYVGVRASDLTMSFLFCKAEKEFPSEIVGGVVPCRVFLLDDPANKEKVKVWVSTEQAFPLQAEFFRYGEEKAYRLLEAGGFTKKNDLYYVRKIRIEGPGWRTRIDFDADSAVVDFVKKGEHPDIIMKLEK